MSRNPANTVIQKRRTARGGQAGATRLSFVCTVQATAVESARSNRKTAPLKQAFVRLSRRGPSGNVKRRLLTPLNSTPVSRRARDKSGMPTTISATGSSRSLASLPPPPSLSLVRRNRHSSSSPPLAKEKKREGKIKHQKPPKGWHPACLRGQNSLGAFQTCTLTKGVRPAAAWSNGHCCEPKYIHTRDNIRHRAVPLRSARQKYFTDQSAHAHRGPSQARRRTANTERGPGAAERFSSSLSFQLRHYPNP